MGKSAMPLPTPVQELTGDTSVSFHQGRKQLTGQLLELLKVPQGKANTRYGSTYNIYHILRFYFSKAVKQICAAFD